MATWAVEVLEALIQMRTLAGPRDRPTAARLLVQLVDSAPPELILLFFIIGVVWVFAFVCMSGALCGFWGLSQGYPRLAQLLSGRQVGGRSADSEYESEMTPRGPDQPVYEGTMIVGAAPCVNALSPAPPISALTDQDGGAVAPLSRRRGPRPYA